MAITSSAFAKALWPGINAWYGQAYDEHKEEWSAIFPTYTSKKQFEEDVGVSGFGLAHVKNEGSSITYDTESQAFLTRYTHVVRGLGFIVTRELFEDDLYNVAGQRRAKGLAFSMRQTKETVAANILNNAFVTDGTKDGGDGVSLIASAGAGDTNHPNFAGGNWTNGPSADTDLSEAALEQACIDIGKWENDRGLKISVMPECLIVPVDLMFEAERILMSPYRVASADNDINALHHMSKFPGGIKVNHYLTDTDAWFVKTNVQDGFKCFQRRKMEFGIDNDFDTENAKFKATERYSFGWTDPRCVYGSEGA